VKTFWAIAFGAAVGGVSRYYLSAAVQHRMGTTFPWGTLLINITGSLILGFIMYYALATPSVSVGWRLMIAIGFCGAYTTFSSYAFETMYYFEQGHWLLFAANILANNVLCLAAVLAGVALARAI